MAEKRSMKYHQLQWYLTFALVAAAGLFALYLVFAGFVHEERTSAAEKSVDDRRGSIHHRLPAVLSDPAVPQPQ